MLQFRQVENQSELEAIYRLRYAVYCLERKFLPAEDYPDGRETDEFDEHCVQFVALDTDDDGQPLGCFRLILPNHHGFPCEEHFELSRKSPEPMRTVEMSRLIVSPGARRMWRHILMGLSKEIYIYNNANVVRYNYAVIDEGFLVVLKKFGLPFKAIGPKGSYMGEPIPTMLSMETLEEVLPIRNPWFYDYFQAPRDEQGAWF